MKSSHFYFPRSNAFILSTSAVHHNYIILYLYAIIIYYSLINTSEFGEASIVKRSKQQLGMKAICGEFVTYYVVKIVWELWEIQRHFLQIKIKRFLNKEWLQRHIPDNKYICILLYIRMCKKCYNISLTNALLKIYTNDGTQFMGYELFR